MIPRHLAVALKEIGIMEVEGNNSNPRINEYLESVGMRGDDEIPWCAAFVNWALEQVDVLGTKSPAARSFLTWGYRINDPMLGCIVVLKRGSGSWQGHVGIFLDDYKGYIRILGGNQLNRVGINAYPKIKLLGFRWHNDIQNL